MNEKQNKSALLKLIKKLSLKQQDRMKLVKTLVAAIKGDPDAMFNMGQIYENGKYGERINLKVAANWYKKAAEKYRTELAAHLKDKKLFDTINETEKEYWKIFNRANPEHAKPQLAEEPVPLEPVKPKNNT